MRENPPEKPHFDAYDCTTCGAKPGQPCTTKRGDLYPHHFHADRVWKGVVNGWYDNGR